MSSRYRIVTDSMSPRSNSRQSETPRTRLHQFQRPSLRPTSANNNIVTNGYFNDPKPIGGITNNMRCRKRQPCRRVYLGPPRCSRTGPNLLPPMFSYKRYGCSTDPNCDDSNVRTQIPNPYMELAKEICLAVRQNEEHYSRSETPTCELVTSFTETPTIKNTNTQAESDSCPDHKNINILIKGETPTVSGDADEKMFRAHHEQDDDEEDDDDEGMNQVSASDLDNLMGTQLQMIKIKHQANMEEIATNVQPRKLLHHLQKVGYFNYNYNSHARTTMENLNIKQGNKKPIERLLSILSTH